MDTMPPWLFYGLFAVTVAGALGVVTAAHPVYAVLSLMLTLFGLSALFVGLGAYFVAVIQILVYAGAVLVLFLFVVMLMEVDPKRFQMSLKWPLRVVATIVGGFFVWQIVRTYTQMELPAARTYVAGTVANIGKQLFTTYALPFEVASLLLLVGIIGAIVLGKQK
jgi:NADH-quinone oxidoreductase subunit J